VLGESYPEVLPGAHKTNKYMVALSSGLDLADFVWPTQGPGPHIGKPRCLRFDYM
jgi:hypothetical protein